MFWPAGFGKSVCFQALPFFDHKLRLFGGQKSAIVVVSPLIVLMVAQVRSLRGRDVEAVIISSGRDYFFRLKGRQCCRQGIPCY